MTILKDDELNYDCDIWFLKERRKNVAQRSQIAIFKIFFYVFIYLFLKSLSSEWLANFSQT